MTQRMDWAKIDPIIMTGDLPYHRIATEHGISHTAIAKRARLIGAPKPTLENRTSKINWAKWDDVIIAGEESDGEIAKRIAAEDGITCDRRTVGRRRRKLGIDPAFKAPVPVYGEKKKIRSRADRRYFSGG